MSKAENGSLHRLEDGSYLVVGEAASRSFSVYTSAREAGAVAGDREEIVRIPAAPLDTYVKEKVREEREAWRQSYRDLGPLLKKAKEDGMLDTLIEANLWPEPACTITDAEMNELIRDLSPSTQGGAGE
jgi:hypothetical protein